MLSIFILPPAAVGLGSFVQSCSWSIMLLKDLPYNYLGNLLHLDSYLNGIFFFFLLPSFMGVNSCLILLSIFCGVSDQSPLSDLSSAHYVCHMCGKCRLGRQDVGHLKEGMLIQRKLVENISLLFLCHLEGLPGKLPCRTYCSVE